MHDVQTAVHVHGQEIDEQAQRELESRAAGLKVAQTGHATATIQMCREACGGAGYLQENRLPHLKADTDVFTTFEGDNTVLLQLVAKGLLTGYRDNFGSLDGWGRVGFVADMVRETVLERTAARALIARLVDAVPGVDDVPMLDRGWQLKMFEFREKHSLEGATRRLRKNSTTEGMAPFDMFNDVQDHVLKSAQTHIERIVLEAFVAGVDRTDDPAARRLLDTLCDLYALSTLEADKAWFLEHGQLTPARAKTAHRHGEPAAPGAAAAPGHAGRRLRDPGRVEGRRDPRGGARPAGGHGRAGRRAARADRRDHPRGHRDRRRRPPGPELIIVCVHATRRTRRRVERETMSLKQSAEPDGEDGDVVLGVRQEHPAQHPVAEPVQRQAGALAQHPEQLVGARVDVAVAPLDQAVGVEQHRRPARRAPRSGPRGTKPGSTPSSRSAVAPSSSRVSRRRRRAAAGGGCPALDQRSSMPPASCRLQVRQQRRRHRAQRQPRPAPGPARSAPQAGEPPLE